MRRLAILAVVLALAGCGEAELTRGAANCLKHHGWKVEYLSTKELRATRVHAGITYAVTYRPPASPVFEILSAAISKPGSLPACFPGH